MRHRDSVYRVTYRTPMASNESILVKSASILAAVHTAKLKADDLGYGDTPEVISVTLIGELR